MPALHSHTKPVVYFTVQCECVIRIISYCSVQYSNANFHVWRSVHLAADHCAVYGSPRYALHLFPPLLVLHCAIIPAVAQVQCSRVLYTVYFDRIGEYS